MGMSTGPRSGKSRVMAEINITPFTDVCLVLLIIFMVSASFLGAPHGRDVKLPTASRQSSTELPPRDITIALNRAGDLFIDDKKATLPEVRQDLQDYSTTNKIHNVIIKADQSVMYDDVVRIMDTVRGAGVTYMSLAVDQSPTQQGTAH